MLLAVSTAPISAAPIMSPGLAMKSSRVGWASDFYRGKTLPNVSTVCSLCFAAGSVRGLGASGLNKKKNESIHCFMEDSSLKVNSI